MLIIKHSEVEPILVQEHEINAFLFQLHDAYSIVSERGMLYFDLFNIYPKLILQNHDDFFISEIKLMNETGRSIEVSAGSFVEIVDKLEKYSNDYMLVDFISDFNDELGIRIDMHFLTDSEFYKFPIPVIRGSLIDEILAGL